MPTKKSFALIILQGQSESQIQNVELQEEQQDDGGQYPRLVFINEQEAILVHQ